MCANIYVFIYFMISYGKYIAILYHYLTFPVNTRVRSPSVGLGLGIEGFVPFGEVAEAVRSGTGSGTAERGTVAEHRVTVAEHAVAEPVEVSKQGSDPAVLPAVLPSTGSGTARREIVQGPQGGISLAPTL